MTETISPLWAIWKEQSRWVQGSFPESTSVSFMLLIYHLARSPTELPVFLIMTFVLNQQYSPAAEKEVLSFGDLKSQVTVKQDRLKDQ